MSKKKLSNFVRKIRVLELINDGVLPASALGSTIGVVAGILWSVSTILPVIGASVGGAVVSIIGLRQYLKHNKRKLFGDLEDFRLNGELNDKKYQELKAILNKITVEGGTTIENQIYSD